MAERLRILLVDDDAPARRAIASFIARGGDEVDTAEDGVAALGRLSSAPYDLVLSDVRMPRLDGLALAQAIRKRNEDSVVVLMSAFASVENVIAALRQGAYDYLIKPVEPQQLSAMLGRVRERLGLRRKVRALTDALSARDALAGLVAGGPAMTAVLDSARRASACDLSVLVTGETGTGKDILARAIHGLSLRAAGPFESVDCAAADAAGLERDLFGLSDGVVIEAGRLSAARGGTLMVEEVTALPLSLQARLVHALEGAAGEVRVLATASDTVEAMRRDGRFRSDLYFSLRTIEIRMPPLRERREDIPRLVEHFLTDARRGQESPQRMAPEALSILMAAPWPGNVRELEAVVRGASAMAGSSETVTTDHLPPAYREIAPRTSTLAEQVQAYERAVLRQALEAVDGQVGRAARVLGVPERTLRRKMRQFGIAKEAFRRRGRAARAVE